MREELTVRDRGEYREMGEEDAADLAEDTMIVDPQELDFHSIFEEIDVEELSDITRAIGISSEGSSTGAVVPQTYSENSSVEEKEESTGDLELKESKKPQAASASAVDRLVQEPTFAPEKISRSAKAKPPKDLLLLPLVLILLVAALAVYHFVLSKGPGGIRFLFQPGDAKLFLDGKEVPGSSPLKLDKIPSRRRYSVHLQRAGYDPYDGSIYVYPNWNESLTVSLVPKKLGPLEVSSDPPGAEILIDGKQTGLKTPATIEAQDLKFPATLELLLEGAPPWVQRVESISPAGVKVFAQLQESTGILDVQSSPSGAAVKIDGKPQGKTPISGRRVPANTKFSLHMEIPGYRPYENEVSLAPGQKLQIYHAMEKNPSR